jgi:hypothetical protein
MKIPFKISQRFLTIISLVLASAGIVATASSVYFFLYSKEQINVHETEKKSLEVKLEKVSSQASELSARDEFKINKELEGEISKIKKTYTDSIGVFEKLNDLKSQKVDTAKLDPLYARSVKYLSDKNYASAAAVLSDLGKQIQDIIQKPLSPGLQLLYLQIFQSLIRRQIPDILFNPYLWMINLLK